MDQACPEALFGVNSVRTKKFRSYLLVRNFPSSIISV